MKKRIAEIIFVAITFIVTVINIAFYINSAVFYDLDNLPGGNFLYSVMSPDGSKTLKMYSVDIENIGTAVRGEVVLANETYNIYWQTNTTNAIAAWNDENTVIVNGNVVDIKGEPYDSRNHIELPEGSAKNFIEQ